MRATRSPSLALPRSAAARRDRTFRRRATLAGASAHGALAAVPSVFDVMVIYLVEDA
jgi:hypothetical protein